ncbi:MAG: hypothetical protein K2H38_09360 [Muribaculaceae bacterium]|nr:hypothetical protein [Muribaculaceae bacterium]
MKEDTIDFKLPAENPEETSRECHMSIELFQNARQTMGELRDLVRETGISWDFLSQQIERAQHPSSPVDKALDRMDDYSTGLGKTLHDKDSNIW